MVIERISQVWGVQSMMPHPTHCCKALLWECQTLQSESAAEGRMKICTHHNKLPNKAAMGTIQLESKVRCHPSKISWLRSLCSDGPSIPTKLRMKRFCGVWRILLHAIIFIDTHLGHRVMLQVPVGKDIALFCLAIGIASHSSHLYSG